MVGGRHALFAGGFDGSGLYSWPGLRRVKANGAPCWPGMIHDHGPFSPASWRPPDFSSGPVSCGPGADGSSAGCVLPLNADFRDQEKKLATSAKGAIVNFGFEVWGKSPLRFDLRARKLSHDPPADDQTRNPKQDGLSIERRNGERHPTLDGHPIALKPYEQSQSWPSTRMEVASCWAQIGICEPTTQRVNSCGVVLPPALPGRSISPATAVWSSRPTEMEPSAGIAWMMAASCSLSTRSRISSTGWPGRPKAFTARRRALSACCAGT